MTNNPEPTREELIRDVRAGSWSAMQKAADLLEADQQELDALDAEVESQGAVIIAKDAEIARLNRDNGDAYRNIIALSTAGEADDARIAELDALVREALAQEQRYNDSFERGLPYCVLDLEWINKAQSLLNHSEGTK